MSAKTNAEVVIDGKVYTLSGYENEEYLQKVTAYINNKIAEFDDMDEYKHLPGNMKSTLIELNIADDYFKAKALVEKLEGDIENKDKEIYDLKHDLISNQVKTENAEASMKELEATKQGAFNSTRRDLRQLLRSHFLMEKSLLKNLHMLLKGQMTVAINSNKREQLSYTVPYFIADLYNIKLASI